MTDERGATADGQYETSHLKERFIAVCKRKRAYAGQAMNAEAIKRQLVEDR
jgi:hypothetical protein